MRKRIICVILAAVCWGCIGLVTRPLGDLGLSSMQITIVRMICTTIFMGGFLLIKDKSLFKISVASLPVFLIAGANFFGLTFFYLSAIRENNSAPVAAMLLYTNPVWLTLFSRVLFKERVSILKLLSLAGAMAGCALLLLTQELSVSPLGILYGLLAGLSQALYSVFGKLLSKDNRAETNTFYTFLFSTLVALPFIDIAQVSSVTQNHLSVCLCLFSVLVIGLTILPYTVYIIGLKKVPVSVAGLLCILEPVVASVAGICFFGDPINTWGVIGIAIVVVSLLLIEFDNKVTLPKHRSRDPLDTEGVAAN